MQIFVRDKKFYTQLAAIAIPIALQNLISFGVSMADTVMVGMLGEVQLSAASIANQLGFIFMLFCFGTGSGSGVLIAQFWGKNDVESIHKVITIMYRIQIVISLAFTALAVLFPRQVVMVFTTDEAVIVEAVKFLRIVGLSYLFAGVASSTVIVLRSVRSVKISVLVYVCSLAINVFLNWVLIFGKLGAPVMGVEGAAWATCVARLAEVIIAMAYIFFFEKKILYRPAMLFARRMGILRNFAANSVPVVINELLWGTGISVVAVVIGRMGKEFVAANAICSVLSQLVTIVLFGISNAAAVMIGNTVGRGDYELAKDYAKTITAMSFILGIFSCGGVLLLREPMLSLYNVSDLTRLYARQITTIYAFVIIFASVACVTLIGVLRGAGDTRFVMAADLVFLWLVSIPFGFFTGLYLGWPVWAVYIMLKLDEFLKVIMTLTRIARGKWINDVTRSEDPVNL